MGFMGRGMLCTFYSHRPGESEEPKNRKAAFSGSIFWRPNQMVHVRQSNGKSLFFKVHPSLALVHPKFMS